MALKLVFLGRLEDAAGAEADRGLIAVLREHGLALLDWSKGAATLRRRLAWLHSGLGAPWPDMSDEALTEALDDWLLPFLPGEASLARTQGADPQRATEIAQAKLAERDALWAKYDALKQPPAEQHAQHEPPS